MVSVMPRLPLTMVFQDQGQLSQGRELSGRCIAFHNTALEAAQLLPQSICQEWVVKASYTLEQDISPRPRRNIKAPVVMV